MIVTNTATHGTSLIFLQHNFLSNIWKHDSLPPPRLPVPSSSPGFCTVTRRKGAGCPFLRLFRLLCLLVKGGLPVCSVQPRRHRLSPLLTPNPDEMTSQLFGRAWPGCASRSLTPVLPSTDSFGFSAVSSSQYVCTLLPLLSAALSLLKTLVRIQDKTAGSACLSSLAPPSLWHSGRLSIPTARLGSPCLHVCLPSPDPEHLEGRGCLVCLHTWQSVTPRVCGWSKGREAGRERRVWTPLGLPGATELPGLAVSCNSTAHPHPAPVLFHCAHCSLASNSPCLMCLIRFHCVFLLTRSFLDSEQTSVIPPGGTWS